MQASSSPYINQFLSADTIVPGYANPQNLNRFAYVVNNPLKYIDPTGHDYCVVLPWLCGSSGGPNSGSGSSGGGGGQPQPSPDNGDNCLIICEPGNSNEPSDPLDASYLNAYYSQLTNNAVYGAPLLPPSPFACGWFDCGLSVGSFVASALTMTEVPQIVIPAVVVDVAATAIAIIRTNEDHSQGEISDVQQWALNGTGLLGLIPGPWGAGFSFINVLVTLSGYPN